DIARTAQTRPVDWEEVARRARDYRVATVTWCTLDLLQTLIGVDGADRALAALRPGALRCRLLARMVNAERVAALHDRRSGRLRYLLLLLLVDRPRDIARLIFRTLWPEAEWLAARYGGRTSRWRHLWNVVRYGQICGSRVNRRRRLFIVAEIALAGLLLPVAVFPSPVRIAALLLLPLLWLLRRAAGYPLLPVTLLNSPLLLLLVMVLVTVLITPDLEWSLPKVAGIVYGAQLYLATVSVVRADRRFFWPALALLLLAGAGIGAVGLLGMQATSKLPFVQPLVNRLPAQRLANGELISPNEIAGVLLWMAPLAVALPFAGLRYRQRRLLPAWLPPMLVLLPLSLAAVLLLSQSRGGLLGFGV